MLKNLNEKKKSMIIETDRLILQKLKQKNIQTLHDKIFTNKNVMEYAFSEKIFSFNETKAFISQNFIHDNSSIGLAPLFLKQNNTLIGFAGILECDYFETKDYEFGFILANEFWHQGYATEIGKAQIKFLFQTFKFNRILALANQNNIASKAVLTKLKMNHIKNIVTKDRGTREIYMANKYNK